jgi:hypothetical protein
MAPTYNPKASMRVKLKLEQLNELKRQLPFEVVLEQPRDVRGFLEILGHNMPWNESGYGKFGDPIKRPNRVAFSVEAAEDGFICDVHPAFACYVSSILDHTKNRD